MIVASIPPSRHREALQLFFRDAPAHLRENNLQWSLDRVATGEMNADGLLGLYDGGDIVGSTFSQVFPDGYVSHWLPEVAGDNFEGEDQLLQEAIRRSEHAGGHIHQVMLEMQRRHRMGALLRNGFTHLTRILNLVRYSATALPIPVRPEPLGDYRIVSATIRQLAALRELIPRTHFDSLDCPEMNGLQSPDEILAGYRFTAPNLGLWRTVECDGREVGIAVVSHPSNAIELNYLGILPEYRRRGLAAALVSEIIEIAKLQSSAEVSVNVDVRNRPARRLYDSFGFEVAAMQEAFVKIAGQGSLGERPEIPARL